MSTFERLETRRCLVNMPNWICNMVGCRDDRHLASLIDQLAIEEIAKFGAKAADSGVQMRRSMQQSFCMLGPASAACAAAAQSWWSAPGRGNYHCLISDLQLPIIRIMPPRLHS